MNTIHITLTGRPISANHMWRSSVANNGRPFTYMPTAAKEMREFWRMLALQQLRKQGRKKIDTDTIHLDIKFYFETRAQRDIDNYLKVVLDSMTGIIYDDDKQVKSLRAEKFHDPVQPRIEIIITP